MTDDEIIRMVINEFRSPSLAVTRQYLDIHEPLEENGSPIITRIDREVIDGCVSVYIPVKNEVFYFVVYIDKENGEITGFDTAPHIRIYFCARSEKLQIDELTSLTSLKPSKVHIKNSIENKNALRQRFNRIIIEPGSEPDTFENKLNKILDLLEKDTAGIQELTRYADCYISAVIRFHNSNSMLGEFTISSLNARRMAILNLDMNFDLYANGKLFRGNLD